MATSTAAKRAARLLRLIQSLPPRKPFSSFETAIKEVSRIVRRMPLHIVIMRFRNHLVTSSPGLKWLLINPVARELIEGEVSDHLHNNESLMASVFFGLYHTDRVWSSESLAAFCMNRACNEAMDRIIQALMMIAIEDHDRIQALRKKTTGEENGSLLPPGETLEEEIDTPSLNEEPLPGGGAREQEGTEGPGDEGLGAPGEEDPGPAWAEYQGQAPDDNEVPETERVE